MLRIIEASLGKIYHPTLHRIRLLKKNRMIQMKLREKISMNQVLSEKANRKPYIYVDVTEVFQNDKGTGIQRVTKEIAKNLKELLSETSEFGLCEVYCKDGWYFVCKDKAPVDFCRGDILFLLDYSPWTICSIFLLYKYLLEHEIKVVSFFYDLIPIKYPEFCEEGIIRDCKKVVKRIFSFSQIICDSNTVAAELKEYLAENPRIRRNPDLKISYSLLGSDFAASTSGFNTKPRNIQECGESINFLMVSTVEPRKMYAQAVKAFDILWKKGLAVNLWIVGRPGWKNKKTISLIENHHELGKKLLWFKTGISDTELNDLYSKCDAVLFASLTEGFGLAVAEGAYHKKPLILRDLPVFREIADDNAFYFTGTQPEQLAEKIEEWIPLYKKGMEPKSENIKLKTWKECSQRVLELLTKKECA